MRTSFSLKAILGSTCVSNNFSDVFALRLTLRRAPGETENIEEARFKDFLKKTYHANDDQFFKSYNNIGKVWLPHPGHLPDDYDFDFFKYIHKIRDDFEEWYKTEDKREDAELQQLRDGGYTDELDFQVRADWQEQYDARWRLRQSIEALGGEVESFKIANEKLQTTIDTLIDQKKDHESIKTKADEVRAKFEEKAINLIRNLRSDYDEFQQFVDENGENFSPISEIHSESRVKLMKKAGVRFSKFGDELSFHLLDSFASLQFKADTELSNSDPRILAPVSESSFPARQPSDKFLSSEA